MSFSKNLGVVLALTLVSAMSLSASAAGVYITEWMYSGDEFIEITNTGNTAVDMTGWSYDDDSRTAGTLSLSGFGIVAAGESVIISESLASEFRTTWGLAASVKVVGGNTANLGRADEINIYDTANNLVDRLTYNDQTGKGPRTQNISGNIPPAALGTTGNATNAVLSFVGDAYGSKTASGFTANPGSYIPEPASMTLLALGGLALLARRR